MRQTRYGLGCRNRIYNLDICLSKPNHLSSSRFPSSRYNSPLLNHSAQMVAQTLLFALATALVSSAAPIAVSESGSASATTATATATSTSPLTLTTESVTASDVDFPFSDAALLSKYDLPADVVPIVLKDSVFFINTTIAEKTWKEPESRSTGTYSRRSIN